MVIEFTVKVRYDSELANWAIEIPEMPAIKVHAGSLETAFEIIQARIKTHQAYRATMAIADEDNAEDFRYDER